MREPAQNSVERLSFSVIGTALAAIDLSQSVTDAIGHLPSHTAPTPANIEISNARQKRPVVNNDL